MVAMRKALEISARIHWRQNLLLTITVVSGLWVGFLPAANAQATSDSNSLPRVASINLCADQMLLALAEPGQILSLTNLSHQPEASFYIERALSYPVNTGTVEEILTLHPDIVLAGQFTNSYTLQLLKALGIRVETIKIANSMQSVLANLDNVSAWVQQEARGKQITDTMKQGLAALPKPQHPRPRAAIYDPRGYTVGRDSLRGEMLELAGWHNVASEKGIESYGTLALETVLKLDPDILVESPYSAGTWSRAQAQNSHPALLKRGLRATVITIPSAQTICGGPWSLGVVERLLEARQVLESAATKPHENKSKE